MRKAIITFCALAATAFGANAQNLNQTITISNEYKTDVSRTEKQSLPFCVPDSVRKFNYKFDYSVFDTPYKGAYEFSPYRTRMTMLEDERKNGRFYLNAGAGYQMHPELQAVWNPQLEGCGLFVRQDFSGYYGKYNSTRDDMNRKGPLFSNADIKNDGFDFLENFGADFRIGTKAGHLTFSADHYGIFTQDVNARNSLSAFGFGFNYSLADFEQCPVDAEVNFNLLYAKDKLTHPYEPQSVYENDIRFYGMIGPRLKGKFQIRADYEFRYLMHSRNYSCNWAEGKLLPYVDFSAGVFDFRLGAGLYFLDKMYVRPDVRIDAKLWGGIINPYLTLTGGVRSDSYFQLKSENHFFSTSYAPQLQSSIENLRAAIGLHGSISHYFEYDIRGGYLSMSSDAIIGLRQVDNLLKSAIVYQDYSAGFADARLSWKSKSVEVDGTLSFIKTDIATRGFASAGLSALDLPVFSTDLRATYNFRRRIFAGVSIRTATERNSSFVDIESRKVSMSGYFNLGAHLEFRINKNWSVWLKGLNLLNEGVQNDPFHVESGISGTAGFVWNF